MKKYTTQMFIDRSIEKYGERFDYSLVEYIGSGVEVEIICPKHGSFNQIPEVHLSYRTKHGCYKCSKEATGVKLEIDEVKKRIFEKYGTDYELVSYSTVRDITVKHKCGIVEETSLYALLRSNYYNCKCNGILKRTASYSERLDYFINKSKKVHGDKYDYSEVILGSFRNTRVKIICSVHGYFLQVPSVHMSGNGCRLCANEKIGKSIAQPEETRRKIEDKNGHKLIIIDERPLRTGFNDLKVQCKKCQKKMTFTCSNLILQEVECKFCGMKSRGERNIKRFLERNGIKYKSQKTFSDCINPKSKQPLRFDYYLEELNICVEFDGVHHFKEEEYFGGNKPAWYSKMDYENIKFRDELRDNYCKENGIKMIRIPYWKKDQINNILSEELLGVSLCQ